MVLAVQTRMKHSCSWERLNYESMLLLNRCVLFETLTLYRVLVNCQMCHEK